jgi:hypothetical protein
MTLRSSRVSVEKAVARVARGVQPPLIAIDGLPCSGKGTLVTKLKERVDLDCIYLDDFVLPEEHWRSRDHPAFLFQFIRYDAFLDAVRTLAATERCSYYPFDWNTPSASEHRRDIHHLTRCSAISMASKFSSRAIGAPFCRLLSVAASVHGRGNGASFSCQVWTSTCSPVLRPVPIYWFQAEAFAGSVTSRPLACQLDA